MTTKVIAILGAGSGLGTAMGHRFGSEGYQVALVARRSAPLEALAAELEKKGIVAGAFPGDLGNPENAPGIVQAIRQKFGRIDVLYYSPAGTDAFLPATEMKVDAVREGTELMFFGMVAAVNAVLPEMRERGEGAILAGFGSTAALGLPFMSGPAPAQAAARNYLYSLYGELAQEGIHVGMVTIAAAIKGSAYYQMMEESGDDHAPEGFQIPIVDPQELAGQLWRTANGHGKLEALFPPEQQSYGGS